MQPEPPPPSGPPPEPPVGAYDPTLEGPPPPYPGEPLPLEEPPPERELWPWLLALAIVVVGGLAALIVYATHRHHHKRTVTVVATRAVPSVVSLPRAVAVRRITASGFNAQIRFSPSRRPKGMVIAQAPEGGAKLSQGSAVALTVSGGKPKIVAPNLVGLSAATATKRLQAAGLRSTERLVFASAPPGRVVSQRPAAGAGVAKGATVALTVSKGPQRVLVPNVVGRRRDDAVARLRKAGLVAAVFSVPSSSPRGFVVAQSPRSQTKVPRHSRVRLNVSKGTPAAGGTTTTSPTTPTTTVATARVPKVVGLTMNAKEAAEVKAVAENSLAGKAGFKIGDRIEYAIAERLLLLLGLRRRLGLRRFWGARIVSPFLKRRRLDHAHQQDRETAFAALQLLGDAVDSFHVIVFRPAAQGIGQELFGQAVVKVPAPRILQDAL